MGGISRWILTDTSARRVEGLSKASKESHKVVVLMVENCCWMIVRGVTTRKEESEEEDWADWEGGNNFRKARLVSFKHPGMRLALRVDGPTHHFSKATSNQLQ